MRSEHCQQILSKRRGVCVYRAEIDEERSSVREQRSEKLEYTQSEKRELDLEASCLESEALLPSKWLLTNELDIQKV